MQITYGSYSNDFTEIMDMIDKRLNDKGKNWRHVFKVTGYGGSRNLLDVVY
jgi:epsin